MRMLQLQLPPRVLSQNRQQQFVNNPNSHIACLLCPPPPSLLSSSLAWPACQLLLFFIGKAKAEKWNAKENAVAVAVGAEAEDVVDSLNWAWSVCRRDRVAAVALLPSPPPPLSLYLMRLPLTKHSVNPLLPSRVIKSAWKLAFVLREATEKKKQKMVLHTHLSWVKRPIESERQREREVDSSWGDQLTIKHRYILPLTNKTMHANHAASRKQGLRLAAGTCVVRRSFPIGLQWSSLFLSFSLNVCVAQCNESILSICATNFSSNSNTYLT